MRSCSPVPLTVDPENGLAVRNCAANGNRDLLNAGNSRRRRHTIRYDQTPQPPNRRQRAMPLVLYLAGAALVSLMLFSMMILWSG
jgi:hypothetical protein